MGPMHLKESLFLFRDRKTAGCKPGHKLMPRGGNWDYFSLIVEPQLSGLDSEFSTGIWNFEWIKLKSFFPSLFPWWWGTGKVFTNRSFLSVSDALNPLLELQITDAVDFSKTHEKPLHFPRSSLSRKVFSSIWRELLLVIFFAATKSLLDSPAQGKDITNRH